ncbi:MAG: hypothetical protein Q7U18_13710 [Methylobacter sp.]|nr:hypothetical protein [Methylobacter sp.]
MVETVSCLEYSAVFSKSFCAASHVKANSSDGIGAMFRTKCRYCLIGAESLGSDQYVKRSVLFKSKVCARCKRQSSRLVNGLRCISCYNRERENFLGLNKHGNKLKLVRRYYPARVTFITLTGAVREVEFKKVMTKNEARRSVELTQPDLAKILKIILLDRCPHGTRLVNASETQGTTQIN